MNPVDAATTATGLIEQHGLLGAVVLGSCVLLFGASAAVVWLLKVNKSIAAENDKLKEDKYAYLMADARREHERNAALVAQLGTMKIIKSAFDAQKGDIHVSQR